MHVARRPRPVKESPCAPTQGKVARLLALPVVLAASLLLTGPPALAAPPPPQGFLEICKETRGGLTGTFGFSFAGRTTDVTLTPGATQPVCTPALQVPAGQVSVTERAAPGTELCGIRTVQPGRLAWTRGATAAVTVPAGGPETETTVVFCNKAAPKGSLQICKETRDGLTGTFAFDAAGRRTTIHVSRDVTQPACAEAFDVPAGQVTVTERGLAGTGLCGVRTIPTGRLAWARDRTAAVSVPAGDRTIVVFCNRPVESGAVRICKVAGPGVEPGAPFTFTIRDPATGLLRRIVVRAGECVLESGWDDGAVIEVSESLPDSIEVAGREVVPSTSRRGCAGDHPERACALIAAGEIVEITFTNRRIEGEGRLRLCKIAGPGITHGTEFTFTVRDVAGGAGAPVIVPAGSCADAGEFEHGTTLEVTETLPVGVEVAARYVLPADRTERCAAWRPDRVCVSIRGNSVTEVKFVNRSTAVPGQVKVCKVAGPGVSPGSEFTFTVREAPSGQAMTVVVPAGQCALVGAFDGEALVEVTESVPPGVEVNGREVLPASAGEPCALPQSNRICARVVAGLVTQVLFTNRAAPGPVPVRLCKAAGSPGIAGLYRFTVRILPSGFPRTVYVGVGSCTTLRDFTVSSTVEITEAVPPGERVAFAVTPAGEERACPTPAANRVCANVSSGPTEVVATNSTVAPATGTLRICKVAGVGVAAGEPYDFVIRLLLGGPASAATIPTGACSSFPGIAAGTTVEVTETLPPGSELPPSITIDPPSEARTCPTPASTRACANISAGSTTELRFTNRRAG